MRNAVRTAPEGDVHVLGLGCHYQPLGRHGLSTLCALVQDLLPAPQDTAGAKGSRGDFSTSPGTKKRDAVLQAATETCKMKHPCPIPPLGTELTGLCENKSHVKICWWFHLHKHSSSAWGQLNPIYCVVWLFLRVLSYWGDKCPLWGRLEMVGRAAEKPITQLTALR